MIKELLDQRRACVVIKAKFAENSDLGGKWAMDEEIKKIDELIEKIALKESKDD
jgi:hypothetical protein